MHKHDRHTDDDTNDSNNNHKKSLSLTGENKVETSLVQQHDKTPLLTASLNSPPVASLDLTSHHANARKRFLAASSSSSSEAISPDDTRQASPSSTCSSKEMYANLLMQLRHQGISTSAASNEDVGHHAKLTAAARKEKLKTQLCFQCPVCKKRFQRHIAMNAHFQAEHLGVTGKSDKVCKLCSFLAPDMVQIRHHLLAKHSIDLDSPNACLVEPDSCSRSASSSPLPSSSSSTTEKKMTSIKHCFNNNNNNNSTPAVSITRTTVAKAVDDSITSSSSSPDVNNVVIHEAPGYFVKQETAHDDAEEAKDLSMKNIKRPAAADKTSASLVAEKRLKTASCSQGQASSPETSAFQCQHCNIIFPNVTLYFLHRGFHSGDDPWKCNNCGHVASDMYDFNTHLMSDVHH